MTGSLGLPPKVRQIYTEKPGWVLATIGVPKTVAGRLKKGGTRESE